MSLFSFVCLFCRLEVKKGPATKLLLMTTGTINFSICFLFFVCNCCCCTFLLSWRRESQQSRMFPRKLALSIHHFLFCFCSGVLLRMLQVEGNLEGVSHIFVDEVKTNTILFHFKQTTPFQPYLFLRASILTLII